MGYNEVQQLRRGDDTAKIGLFEGLRGLCFGGGNCSKLGSLRALFLRQRVRRYAFTLITLNKMFWLTLVTSYRGSRGASGHNVIAVPVALYTT